MVSPVDPSSRRVASTTVFNGSQENHFDSTSLHLSFTDYYVPLRLSGQQNQDSQIFFLESYVSVYDSGKWVGDIDILQALSSPNVRRKRNTCKHTSGIESEVRINTTGLLSAESWHDILDPPVEPFVVLANGNWVARLAVSAMLLQILPRSRNGMGFVMICPRWYCWHCKRRFASSAEKGGLGMRAYIY
jgi:hypothetical protein